MDDIPISALLIALFILLLASGFFSAAETSMMAVNRYRLKNLAKAGQHGARLAEWLLARTDKLLGVVLLGNNLINAASASLLTMVAFRLFGANEMALTVATVVVTFLILVFSEVTPKVIGATYPERIAPAAAFVLYPLLKLLNPAVWFVNLFVRGLLRLLRLAPPEAGSGNAMGVEELRTLLAESGSFLPQSHRGILLNLFDLEKLTVDDVMLPRGEIEAIDIDASADEVFQHLQTSHHAHLPVYREELNEIVGIVHVRRALAHIGEAPFDVDAFREGLKAAYFVPSGTPLLTQLSQFQENRQSLGLVVDEYGELLGLVTVEDVLEEIVGEFAGVNTLQGSGWVVDAEGGYLVEGTVSLRDLNRKLGLALPLGGARTLNGLIMEYLEAMPEAGVTIRIAGCTVEIVQVAGRKVKTARVVPERTL
ncbi:MAG: HlyC/CorC family transporter [Thiobacillus sp.]|nr:HlyC/CorC family transporter [Thiobacillus sp.]